MTTYRERRANRADRLEGWAEQRRERAAADLASEPSYVHDWAWITQPGLDRSKENRRTERRFESLDKADSMESRAEGIRGQLEGAIYSDDPDAIERLTERIAELEAERERVKAFNAACRKKGGTIADALELLTPAERRDYASTARSCPTFLGNNGQMPSYVLANLGGNIARQRQRLAGLQRHRAAIEVEPTAETERPDGGTHRIRGHREEIEYPARPARAVLDAVKAEGYRWDRVAVCWWRPVRQQAHAPDIDVAAGY